MRGLRNRKSPWPKPPTSAGSNKLGRERFTRLAKHLAQGRQPAGVSVWVGVGVTAGERGVVHLVVRGLGYQAVAMVLAGKERVLHGNSHRSLLRSNAVLPCNCEKEATPGSSQHPQPIRPPKMPTPATSSHRTGTLTESTADLRISGINRAFL